MKRTLSLILSLLLMLSLFTELSASAQSVGGGVVDELLSEEIPQKDDVVVTSADAQPETEEDGMADLNIVNASSGRRYDPDQEDDPKGYYYDRGGNLILNKDGGVFQDPTDE